MAPPIHPSAINVNRTSGHGDEERINKGGVIVKVVGCMVTQSVSLVSSPAQEEGGREGWVTDEKLSVKTSVRLSKFIIC